MIHGQKTTFNRLLKALIDAKEEQCSVTFTLRVHVSPNESYFECSGYILEIETEEGYKDEDVVHIRIGNPYGIKHSTLSISSKSGKFEKDPDDYLCYTYEITYYNDWIDRVTASIRSEFPKWEGLQTLATMQIKIWSESLEENEDE